MASHVFAPVSRRPSTIRTYLKRADDLKKQAINDLTLPAQSTLPPHGDSIKALWYVLLSVN